MSPDRTFELDVSSVGDAGWTYISRQPIAAATKAAKDLFARHAGKRVIRLQIRDTTSGVHSIFAYKAEKSNAKTNNGAPKFSVHLHKIPTMKKKNGVQRGGGTGEGNGLYGNYGERVDHARRDDPLLSDEGFLSIYLKHTGKEHTSDPEFDLAELKLFHFFIVNNIFHDGGNSTDGTKCLRSLRNYAERLRMQAEGTEGDPMCPIRSEVCSEIRDIIEKTAKIPYYVKSRQDRDTLGSDDDVVEDVDASEADGENDLKRRVAEQVCAFFLAVLEYNTLPETTSAISLGGGREGAGRREINSTSKTFGGRNSRSGGCITYIAVRYMMNSLLLPIALPVYAVNYVIERLERGMVFDVRGNTIDVISDVKNMRRKRVVLHFLGWMVTVHDYVDVIGMKHKLAWERINDENGEIRHCFIRTDYVKTFLLIIFLINRWEFSVPTVVNMLSELVMKLIDYVKVDLVGFSFGGYSASKIAERVIAARCPEYDKPMRLFTFGSVYLSTYEKLGVLPEQNGRRSSLPPVFGAAQAAYRPRIPCLEEVANVMLHQDIVNFLYTTENEEKNMLAEKGTTRDTEISIFNDVPVLHVLHDDFFKRAEPGARDMWDVHVGYYVAFLIPILVNYIHDRGELNSFKSFEEYLQTLRF